MVEESRPASVGRAAPGVEALVKRLTEVRRAEGEGPPNRSRAFACPACRDMGWIVVEREGRPYGRPCSCAALKRIGSCLDGAGIPRRFALCTLDNFNPVTNEQAEALEVAREYVRCFGATTDGLLFMGTVGAGKTHLAVSVGNALIRQGIEVLFVNCRELLQRLTGSLYRSERQELFNRARHVPLLILDDLGSQAVNDYNNDIFMWILEYRYDNRLRTIATSAFPDCLPDPADDRWNIHGKVEMTLADRIGIRARSMLAAMCQTVEVIGPDERYNSQPKVLR